MQVPLKTIIHEVGHLITASLGGLERHGIYFYKNGGGATHGRWNSLESHMAGILAVVELCPETIAEHLRIAFSHSVIISERHPHRNLLSAADISWMDGADYDFFLIQQETDRRGWAEPERNARLSEIEGRVREAIRLNAGVMLKIVEVISEWSEAQAQWEEVFGRPAINFPAKLVDHLTAQLVAPEGWPKKMEPPPLRKRKVPRRR